MLDSQESWTRSDPETGHDTDHDTELCWSTQFPEVIELCRNAFGSNT